VWYDESNQSSDQLLATIERELRERPVFVVVLSPAALKSPWVRTRRSGLHSCAPRPLAHPVAGGADRVREDDVWLFLQDFKRIEAPSHRPYQHAEAVTRTLHALQLTLPEKRRWPSRNCC